MISNYGHFEIANIQAGKLKKDLILVSFHLKDNKCSYIDTKLLNTSITLSKQRVNIREKGKI